jgi:uncharacterized BrkB/YihY/UPF0761 family membrane protein
VSTETISTNKNVKQLLVDVERLKYRTIGKHTMGLLLCIEILSTLFSQFSDVLEEIYGAEQSEEIIKNEFYDIYSKMSDIINEYLTCSIVENLGYMDSTEI